jgi:hypothetical protein
VVEFETVPLNNFPAGVGFVNSRSGLFFFVILGSLLLGACGQGPVRNVNVGDQIAFYDFSQPNTFEEGIYTNARLRIENGIYRINLTEGDNELWWGQWGDTLRDVVIDVDVNQLSELNENAYGVMCRVRGNVGQEIEIDPALAEIAENDEATDEATETVEATETATEESDATETATEEAEADATVEADETESATEEADATEAVEEDAAAEETEAATETVEEEAATEAAEATESITQATEDATAEPTDEATADAVETAESTEQATAEATLEFGASQSSGVQVSNGDGYLFLIQGTGSYGIFRSRNRALTPLVNWTASSAVRVGPGRNHIRAICAGNYLAMYVNDVFVAEANDDAFLEGQVGLVASAANRLGIDVEFDNLQISAVNAG